VPVAAFALGACIVEKHFTLSRSGDVFTEDNIRNIRPGYGLYTHFPKNIIGLKSTENIPAGTPLQWRLISNNI